MLHLLLLCCKKDSEIAVDKESVNLEVRHRVYDVQEREKGSRIN
jgi:hypothetical protein